MTPSDFTKQHASRLGNYAKGVLLINQRMDSISASGFMQDIFSYTTAKKICADVNKTKYIWISLYVMYTDMIGSIHNWTTLLSVILSFRLGIGKPFL